MLFRSELGDLYAMGAWTHYEIGRYGRALELADTGLDTIAGRGPNVELHLRPWRVASLYRLGRWDEALEEFAAVRAGDVIDAGAVIGDLEFDPDDLAAARRK